MSSNPSKTPQDKPATEAAQDNTSKAIEAWTRPGRIVWGRPPQETFKAGPLPRDEGLARLMAMPPHPQPAAKPTITGSVATGSTLATGQGIAGGGNIPRAQAPVASQQPTPPVAARPMTGLGGFSNVPQPSRTVVEKPAEPAPVEPEKSVTEVQPVISLAAIAEDVVPMSSLEPVVARRATVVEQAPSAAVTTKDRKPATAKWVVGGVVVLALAVGGLWWMNRSADAPAVATPAEVAPQSAEPAPLAPVQDDATDSAETQASAPPAATTPAPAPVTAAPPAKAAANTPARSQTSEPVATPRPAPVAQPAPQPVPAPEPAPVVVQVPADTPPPTVARPAQTDPDAPVVTRPQPLD